MRRFSVLLCVLVAGCLSPWGVLPIPDRAEIRERGTSLNGFALDLYAQLVEPDGNLFFSPSCIREALAMAHVGARGDTAAEIAKVLHLPDDPEQARRALTATRPRVNTGSGGVQFHQAASLWGQRGYGFQRSFLSFLDRSYAAKRRPRQRVSLWPVWRCRSAPTPSPSSGLTTRSCLPSAMYEPARFSFSAGTPDPEHGKGCKRIALCRVAQARLQCSGNNRETRTAEIRHGL